VKVLDRYVVAELVGPFLFGLAAFTMLFVAGNLLNIARLVSEEHASIWAAAKYFVYTLPSTLVLTFPMSMLLAVLTAMSRISGESELNAMRAGGISLYRIALPLVGVGLVASIVALLFQEFVVPGAVDQANLILRTEIQSGGSGILSNQVVSNPLPDGGVRVTYAQGFDPATDELRGVTIEEVHNGVLTSILYAPRGTYNESSWRFFDANSYTVAPDCCKQNFAPVTDVDIGADPSRLIEVQKQPDDMSRAELAQLLHGGVKQGDTSRYDLLLVTYDNKLARPFASLVFTLLAMPLGIRSQRSSSGAGFGISILIVFGFYVVTTVCLAVGRTTPSLALTMAWLPNVLFFGAGLWLLSRAAKV